MSILFQPYFHDEEAAYQKVESIVWPNGPICPHCGNVDEVRIYKLQGKSHRMGLRKCGECRKQFTVKVGTIFESSHVPLFKWLQAIFLITSSKKGISANQLHRTLDVTLKTAWFMGHRIREAMRCGDFDLMGGNGGILEKVVTDEASQYKHLNQDFQHDFVRHGQGEYGRGDTNTIEGYFSIFKRGMKSVYQHCAKKHLHRYLAEFDFRYSERKIDDSQRDERLLKFIVGRRMTYRDSYSA